MTCTIPVSARAFRANLRVLSVQLPVDVGPQFRAADRRSDGGSRPLLPGQHVQVAGPGGRLHQALVRTPSRRRARRAVVGANGVIL